MIGVVLSIIAPVFVCAGIGFIWTRSGRAFDTELVTSLVVNIGTPCLVFATLARLELNLQTFGSMALAAAVATAGLAGVSAVVLKISGHSQRAFLPAMMFTNCGNMGLPLSLLAFGEKGLALAIAFFTVSVVVMFTIGVGISAGTVSVRKLAAMPVFYAVGAALVFMIAGVKPPEWIANTTKILGDMTIPLMLLTLGISLGGLRLDGVKRSLGLSVAKLVIGFAVGVAVAEVFGFEGAARGVLILLTALPVAVFSYLFAERYKTSSEEVAGMVVVSTALSFATLPILLWYLL